MTECPPKNTHVGNHTAIILPLANFSSYPSSLSYPSYAHPKKLTLG